MQRVAWAVVVVCCGGLVGCGPGYKVAPVSGKVTVKGKPLAEAVVQFIPESGTKGSGGVGQSDADGHYALKGPKGELGVAPGEYKIRVSRLAGPDGKTLARGETEAENPGYRETIPPPWGGGHPTKSVDVPSDGATIDIAIDSKLLEHGAHPK